MSNPVFDRINKDVSRGGYADFGSRPSSAPPSYGQYGAQDNMSAQQMEDLYNAPPATAAASRKLTVDDVVMKALGLFAILLVSGGITMFALVPMIGPVLVLPAIVITLVLGIVIAMKKTVSVPLIVLYAGLEGVLVGAVTAVYGNAFGQGVVTTAVFATLSVFIAMFVGWKTGFVKVTSKSRRIFGMAIMGYLVFAVANLVAAWAFGANSGWGFFGFGSGMSILVSVVAVGLASYSLAMDFDSIDRAVAAQVPERYSWLLAHGLIVTLVWLYLEILRLVAQLQGRD